MQEKRLASHSCILKIANNRKSRKLVPKPFCSEVSKIKKLGGWPLHIKVISHIQLAREVPP